MTFKSLSLLIFLGTLILIACQTVDAPTVEFVASASKVPPALPTRTLTPRLPVTLSPQPSFTLIPSLTPTETPRTDIAPTLPPADVNFIFHGDREKPYVALTFDLCQKPEYPAWFDQGIVDVLTEYNAPATFFMGGD